MEIIKMKAQLNRSLNKKKVIRLIILIYLLLLSVIAFAQEEQAEAETHYNKTNIELDAGFTKFRDITPIQRGNLGIALRYMPSKALGVRTRIGYIATTENFISTDFQGVINVTQLIKNKSENMKRFGLLLGLGGTYTYMTRLDDIRKATVIQQKHGFHLSGRVDLLAKMNNNMSLFVSLQNIAGVNSNRYGARPDKTDTTSILHFNVGVSIGVGKRAKKSEHKIEKQLHSDWVDLDKKEN